TTAGCNLRCVHCRRLDVADRLTPLDLSTAEAEAMIDQLREIGRPVLILSGGEALMRPDIYHLADYARAQEVPVALATNGTLVDGTAARRIAESGIRRVAISFDGADADTHDRFRGAAGSFSAALEGAAALRARGVDVQVNTTVAKHNSDQLDAMIRLVNEIGAVGLHLFLLVPVGCGAVIADDQMISAEEYEATLNWLYDTQLASPDLELRATCAPHYQRVVRMRGAAEGASKAGPVGTLGSARGATHRRGSATGCLAGTAVAFVSHEGRVFPCGYFPVAAGSIRRESFASIWNDSALFARLRNPESVGGKCGACAFRYACGGCRARAYGVTGDYLAEEPYCVHDPVAAGGSRL
ncbi:MAG: radical SAM protein, partial [Spirochaetales bacterium]|nr:radical SAM protein [Spirochaetales bacterium]